MKTDLKKVLSVSGQPGLFIYLSHANNGAIVESIVTKKRTCFGMNARMTSLADISIFTETDEVRLQEVFEKMKAYLGENDAPSGKSDSKVLIDLFENVLPDYDRDRFYVSHMKKVVEWYNFLKNNASLDFGDDAEGEEGAEEAKVVETAKPKAAAKPRAQAVAKAGKADAKAKSETKRTKSSAK